MIDRYGALLCCSQENKICHLGSTSPNDTSPSGMLPSSAHEGFIRLAIRILHKGWSQAESIAAA
jgi:hypothetical protein